MNLEYKTFGDEICVYGYDMRIGTIKDKKFEKAEQFVLHDEDSKKIDKFIEGLE